MAQSAAGADMEDWSLQAIVRGSSGDLSKIADMDTFDRYHDDNLFSDFISGGYQSIDHEFFASFPGIFDREMDSRNGLEELYKPFYHVAAQSSFGFQENEQKSGVEGYKRNQESDQSSGNNYAKSVCKAVSTPKYKRRKNQHKRVVIQVSADDITSDKWAWRKYGQKPIKGSPYPRSYYRCSSSKGCLARKQVEQSCDDPGMFILTYTAEHSHSLPTRRNSLSGTIRQKFPSSKAPNMPLVKQEKDEEPSSPNSTKTHTHFSSTDEDFHPRIKQEGKIIMADINDADDFDMSDDLILNGEFFSGLEDFDDFVSELGNSHTSSPQFPHANSST
ncbi:WRKY transcription factor 22-like isoform X1 [Primulina huaijiensis]|uniref:WRKY transcription factor 22-like isoform X1 n=1 Tax=Primulina huaijiensis TaxID=1492673 RepID=UPI003CC6F18A